MKKILAITFTSILLGLLSVPVSANTLINVPSHNKVLAATYYYYDTPDYYSTRDYRYNRAQRYDYRYHSPSYYYDDGSYYRFNYYHPYYYGYPYGGVFIWGR